MRDLIIEYRFILVVALAVFLFALFEWEQFKGVLYALMLQAKGKAKDAVLKSGRAQEDWVLLKAYQYLPKWLTVWIPQEVMRRIISYLYCTGKDYLDDGKINNSI